MTSPKPRSPCLLPPELFVGAAVMVELPPVPPGMVLVQESDTAPARPTPELIREAGVRPHQVDRNVGLHETALKLGDVQEIGREAVTVGGKTVELVKFRADIAICDIINLNYRFYPRSAYEAAIERAQAAMAQGKLTMLLEHPGWEDGWKGRLDAIAARWTALGIEEKQVEFPPDSGQMITKPVVWGEGVYTRTPGGELVQTLMQDGVFVGISTNGYSSVEWVPFGELGVPDPSGLIDPELEIPVTGDDFTLLTIDAVSLPANSGGQVYAESGGYGPPPQRKPESPSRPASVPETPAPRTEAQEEPMHPKLKALCERLGKTLEQVKADHQAEYVQTLEAIAAEGHASTEAASQVASLTTQLSAAQTQLAQTQEALRQSEANRVKESRTAMVDSAIAEANLRQVPPLELNGEQIDLNAKWREGLLTMVLAAPSDEDAATLLAQQVAVRQHEVGTQEESVVPAVQPPRVPAGAPSLPVGNNDAPEPLQSLRTQESGDPIAFNPIITRLRS